LLDVTMPAKTNVTALVVACLIEQYGDASAPDLLPELTGCPKWKSVGVFDRCKAIYDRQDSRSASSRAGKWRIRLLVSLRSPARFGVSSLAAIFSTPGAGPRP
jgi:hypothetical protein